MAIRKVSIRHWLPIVTFCPVNNLPDLIYIEVEFRGDQFAELYTVRKKVRQIASMKKKFMEDICDEVFMAFPECSSVTVTLALGRHVVTRTEV